MKRGVALAKFPRVVMIRTERLEKNHSAVLCYSFAVLCLIAATGIRALLHPMLEHQMPYALFAPAAMLAAWYGRFAVGLLVLGLGTLIGYFFFLNPYRDFGIIHASDFTVLFSEIGPAVVSIWIIELLHRAREKADLAVTREREHACRLENEVIERVQAEKEVSFTQDLTRSIGEADDFHSAVGTTLRMISEFTGWPIGQAWTPSSDGNSMQCCMEWYCRDSLMEPFIKESQGIAIQRGVGLVGAVWENKRLMWVRDLETDYTFQRGEIARRHGLRSAVAIPVLADETVVTVIEFYVQEPRETDERFVRLISTIGSQLGKVMEHKRAEEALRESECRLAEAQGIAHLGSWEWNLETNTTVWSDELYRIYGFATHEFKVSYEAFLERLHPEDRASTRSQVDRCCKTGESYSDVHRIYRTDGQLRYLQTHGRTFRNSEGKIIKLAGTAQDITERMLAEIALQDARRQLSDYAQTLEEKVAMRTAELQRNMKEMQAFCYSIAHDLRAPVRAMEGFSSALMEDYAPHLDAVGREYAGRIIRASQHMDRLIHDLLAYGRLSHIPLPKEWTDISRLITNFEREHGHELKAKGVSITLRQPLPQLWVNPLLLGQIFTNLISNAMKFARPDVPLEIEISAALSNQRVRVCVRDNGIGIAPQHYDRIFRVFERLHGADQREGTGIGLAIVSKGIERMGGTVGVESVPGQGSCFWFELPHPVQMGSESIEPLSCA